MGVEVEARPEELWDFDSDHDAAEEKDHGIRAGGDDDSWFCDEAQGLDEVPESEWCRIDPVEGEVRLLQSRAMMLDATAEVPCFRAEKCVED